jgi:hypothetical protein
MRGRHRRVVLRDILDYRDRTRRERRQTLDQMATDAEDDNLYEVTATPNGPGEIDTVGFPALLDTCVLYPLGNPVAGRLWRARTRDQSVLFGWPVPACLIQQV